VTEIENVSTPQPAPVALAGIDEIFSLLVKICRQRVLELTLRDDFPEPAADLAEGAVWFLDDVQAWINEHGGAVADMLR